jgi:peroxiredoxin Q/BCP
MTKAAKKNDAILSEGDKAPDFTLPTDGNNSVTLAGFKGKKNVVLYFYPKDDTPGCTIEAKDFGALTPEFAKADTIIIGLSKDPVKSHDKFKEKYCLPFTLASDAEDEVCEAYGVWVEKSMYGKTYMGINRATFLIDKKGVIKKVWPKVQVEGHAAEVLKAALLLK